MPSRERNKRATRRDDCQKREYECKLESMLVLSLSLRIQKKKTKKKKKTIERLFVTVNMQDVQSNRAVSKAVHKSLARESVSI